METLAPVEEIIVRAEEIIDAKDNNDSKELVDISSREEIVDIGSREIVDAREGAIVVHGSSDFRREFSVTFVSTSVAGINSDSDSGSRPVRRAKRDKMSGQRMVEMMVNQFVAAQKMQAETNTVMTQILHTVVNQNTVTQQLLTVLIERDGRSVSASHGASYLHQTPFVPQAPYIPPSVHNTGSLAYNEVPDALDDPFNMSSDQSVVPYRPDHEDPDDEDYNPLDDDIAPSSRSSRKRSREPVAPPQTPYPVGQPYPPMQRPLRAEHSIFTNLGGMIRALDGGPISADIVAAHREGMQLRKLMAKLLVDPSSKNGRSLLIPIPGSDRAPHFIFTGEAYWACFSGKRLEDKQYLTPACLTSGENVHIIEKPVCNDGRLLIVSKTRVAIWFTQKGLVTYLMMEDSKQADKKDSIMHTNSFSQFGCRFGEYLAGYIAFHEEIARNKKNKSKSMRPKRSKKSQE